MSVAQKERDQAASVSLGDRMLMIGGQGADGEGGVTASEVELYDPAEDTWSLRADLGMEEGRFSFCAVPLNSTSLMVLGGWGEAGPLASVQERCRRNFAEHNIWRRCLALASY